MVMDLVNIYVPGDEVYNYDYASYFGHCYSEYNVFDI